MRHLRGDIEFAEELAVEYMDARRRPRPGTSGQPRSASEDLNTCLATLLQQIAKSHGVSQTEIVENFGRRSIPIAIGELLPFVLLYLFLSILLVDKVRRQLAGFLKMIRIGNGHMSYRALRVPWPHYQASLVGLYFALLWVVAAVRPVRAKSERQIERLA
jgi:hypothetical protein